MIYFWPRLGTRPEHRQRKIRFTPTYFSFQIGTASADLSPGTRLIAVRNLKAGLSTKHPSDLKGTYQINQLTNQSLFISVSLVMCYLVVAKLGS